jgi:hypothetical protein
MMKKRHGLAVPRSAMSRRVFQPEKKEKVADRPPEPGIAARMTAMQKIQANCAGHGFTPEAQSALVGRKGRRAGNVLSIRGREKPDRSANQTIAEYHSTGYSERLFLQMRKRRRTVHGPGV